MAGRFKLWEFLRTRVIWVLIVLLVPSFILFFHAFLGSPPAAGPGGDAGELFGQRIPWQEFQQEFQWVRQQVESQWGDIPETFEPFLLQQTWNRLLLREEARRRRIRVADEEVARFIRSQPLFQHEGRFDPELYFRHVRALRTTSQHFEAQLRQQLQVDRLLETIRAEVSVTDDELRAAYVEEHERRSAALVVVSVESFRSQALAALSPDELIAYYESHPDAVRTPERVVLDMLGTSKSAFVKGLTVSEEAIRTYYEDHPEEFQDAAGTLQPLEQVAEPIRFRLAEEESRKRLVNLALDLEEDLEAGQSLEEIAQARGLSVQRSDPLVPGHALLPDGPDAEMIHKAFELSVGQTSEVLESSAGVFVVRLVERMESRVPPFEEVRATIERLAGTERAWELARQRAASLHEGLATQRAKGLTIDEACLVLGVEALHPAPFTRQGLIEPLGDVPEVAAAAFLLEPGKLSDVLKTPQGFVIVFAKERLGIDESQVEQDREAFRERLVQDKQQERLSEWLVELRNRAALRSFLEQDATPRGR